MIALTLVGFGVALMIVWALWVVFGAILAAYVGYNWPVFCDLFLEHLTAFLYRGVMPVLERINRKSGHVVIAITNCFWLKHSGTPNALLRVVKVGIKPLQIINRLSWSASLKISRWVAINGLFSNEG